MIASTLHRATTTMPSPYLVDMGYASHNTTTPPLPPYGKEADLLSSWGAQPRNDIFIFAGLDGWRKAKAFKNAQVVLCLPYGKNPAHYSWPVKNCPVLLIDTGFLSILDIEKLAFCLLRADATIVRAILSSNKLVVYRGAA